MTINSDLFKKHQELAKETYASTTALHFHKGLKEFTNYVNSNMSQIGIHGMEFSMKDAIPDLPTRLVFLSVIQSTRNPLHGEWKEFRDTTHSSGLMIKIDPNDNPRVKITAVGELND